ncbi:uncharacterized protein FFMR_03654 [Fusarium fujikuroi]|nr:uncharacterized protein FFMR_03654 [Fusarium fujikuroi]
MTKAEKEERKRKGHQVPYRKDGFICKRRIRPYTQRRDFVGTHACWHCSLSSLKTQAQGDLNRLLADENRTEIEVEPLEWLGKRHLKLDEQPRDPSASPSIDSPTTSDRAPSLPAATNKGKGKAVAKTGVADVPSEASRSSPFPGADRTSDAEMGDADSNEVAATEPADETPLEIAAIMSGDASRERAEVISALRRFLTWSDRL